MNNKRGWRREEKENNGEGEKPAKFDELKTEPQGRSDPQVLGPSLHLLSPSMIATGIGLGKEYGLMFQPIMPACSLFEC